jgi:regulator of protease activity HflC (stomatin/prohibitin superfamily)
MKFILKRIKIRSFEKGLYFQNGEFKAILEAGRYWTFDPFFRKNVEVVSQRDPWLWHEYLDAIVKSGALTGQAEVVDLKDHQRALVWIDERFNRMLGPGLYALWTQYRKVRVEVVDAREVRFVHPALKTILRAPGASALLNEFTVAEGHVGVYFKNGAFVEQLSPGTHAFWKDVAKVTLHRVDQRERVLDVAGQDIMTADKVTLRVNVLAGYRVADARASVEQAEDAHQALYREVQMAVRASVGARELDTLLNDKEALGRELAEALKGRAKVLGFSLLTVGIRDIILPGEMKHLMNRVTEAKKAAEANLIARREETAAMRSQANTAKLLENNPTLMRLRELEVLGTIAEHAKMNVVLGEKGLADRVINLL